MFCHCTWLWIKRNLVCKGLTCDSLWPSDTIWHGWHQWPWSTFIQLTACCLFGHYLKQCWHIGLPRSKLQWNLKQYTTIFSQENSIANVICKMCAILVKLQCAEYPWIWARGWYLCWWCPGFWSLAVVLHCFLFQFIFNKINSLPPGDYAVIVNM